MPAPSTALRSHIDAAPAGSAASCPVCATLVDPLRAPRVAHRGGRFRYYCSAECFERRAQAPDVGEFARGAPREDDGSIANPPARDDRSWRDDGPRADELEAQRDERSPADDARSEVDAAPLAERALPTMVEFDGEPSLDQVLEMLGISSAEATSVAPREPSVDRPSPARAVELPDEPPDARPAILALAATFVAVVCTRVSGIVGTLFAALACFTVLTVAARELWSLRAMAPWWLWVNPFAGALVALSRALVRERPATSLALSSALALVLPLTGWIARAARASGQRALDAQGALLPRTARVKRSDGDAQRTLEAQALRAGEEIVVEAGERVPVDGVVRKGEATVEEPTQVRTLVAGHAVLAGALVRKGTLEILATRAGDDVALARVRTVLDGASLSDGLLRSLPSRALAVTVAFAALALLALSAPRDPLATLALALGALPPGLALSLARVPFAHALADAIRRGTVFRDRASLELSARVRAVVLCVRATLTRGALELVEVVSLGNLSERSLLALAAGAESASPEHPFARALLSAAQSRGVRPEPVRRPVALAGRGVLAANAAGAPIVLGTRSLLIAENVAVAPGEEVARSIEAQGRHALFLAIDGRVEGVFGFEDPPRDEARAAVQSLMDHGIDVALVGGESAGTLEALGLSVDVAHVRAEVSPEERGNAVRSIAEVAGRVAVAGRPALDDLALGAGDVSIGLEAAGGAGAETSIALTSDDLREVSRALLDARAARSRARRASAICLASTSLAVLCAAFAPGPRVAAPAVVLVSLAGALLAASSVRRAT